MVKEARTLLGVYVSLPVICFYSFLCFMCSPLCVSFYASLPMYLFLRVSLVREVWQGTGRDASRGASRATSRAISKVTSRAMSRATSRARSRGRSKERSKGGSLDRKVGG